MQLKAKVVSIALPASYHKDGARRLTLKFVEADEGLASITISEALVGVDVQLGETVTFEITSSLGVAAKIARSAK